MYMPQFRVSGEKSYAKKQFHLDLRRLSSAHTRLRRGWVVLPGSRVGVWVAPAPWLTAALPLAQAPGSCLVSAPPAKKIEIEFEY